MKGNKIKRLLFTPTTVLIFQATFRTLPEHLNFLKSGITSHISCCPGIFITVQDISAYSGDRLHILRAKYGLFAACFWDACSNNLFILWIGFAEGVHGQSSL